MWHISKSSNKYGVALYNFDGKVRHGLPLEIGETVQIQEQFSTNEWYRGFSTRNKTVKGIFPASYIHIKECRVDVEGPHETIIPTEDDVIAEVKYVLREWMQIWRRLYIECRVAEYRSIHTVMLDLIDYRHQLLASTLTQDQCNALKLKITSKIDWGNKLLGLDLVPRLHSAQVDSEQVSTVELYRIHNNSHDNTQRANQETGSLCRANNKATSNNVRGGHHLYCVMRRFACVITDEIELAFCLYDNNCNQFFSERFVLQLTKEGTVMDRTHLGACLFSDLREKDMKRDVYLVAHLYRRGNLKENDSKKLPTRNYKRPFGVAAIHILDLFATSRSEMELHMRVYSCSENDFSTFHEQIIKKSGTKIPGASTNNNGIYVMSRMFHASLEDVWKQEPVMLKGCCVAQVLGLSDVIMPGDVRNDLYFTLQRAEFEWGRKTAPKNIECRIVIIDRDGSVMHNCICAGAGDGLASEYFTCIYYHNNSPKWHEIVKLCIPIESWKRGAHIRLEFRHCSSKDKSGKKLLAFGFIPLISKDDTTLANREHEIFLYKCEDHTKLKSVENYYSLASTAECPADLAATMQQNAFVHNDKESVFVRVQLCSTKLAQNANLLGLLKWKEFRGQPQKIDEYLHKLTKLDGGEIMKYLQDILDILFIMFSTENGKQEPQLRLVFEALIYIFKLLEDSKFEHFKPVMNAYIENHFSAPLVYKELLTCWKTRIRSAALPEAKDKQEHYRKCFKVGQYVVKYIVKSQQLFVRAYGKQSGDEFSSSVCQVFDALQLVMHSKATELAENQCVILSTLRGICDDLVKVVSPHDLTHKVSDLLSNLSPHPSVQHAKLNAISDLVNSHLFTLSESRIGLLPLFVRELGANLDQGSDIPECTIILADVLNQLYLQEKQNQSVKHDMKIIVNGLLSKLIACIHYSNISEPYRGKIVACLIGMLRQMEEYHYKCVIDSYTEKHSLVDFLLQSLQVFIQLVQSDVYPQDWMVMSMVTNNSILMATQNLSRVLTEKFVTEFNFALWSQYFNLAVSFLTQPCLQLERYSEVKKEKILEQYGDLRVQMGYEILAMWQELGVNKIQFVPAMVGPFLEVTLVPETELRKATLPIFFDMMECEQEARGTFKQVESELINKLDILVSENKGDEEYKQLFNTILSTKMQQSPSWQETGSAFIQSVSRLLERLLDYRNVMDSHEENSEKKMTCTVNLLNFYQEMDRHEMYIRYIYKLCDMHVSCGNHVEAAFTLQLHADLLSWGVDTLQADHIYPTQPEWQRKEMLYDRIITYFDKGKCWEHGIPLCEELSCLYREQYDYAKLSNTLQREASFYKKILNELRLEPEYFKVGFYGMNFPLFLRNKEFVYRGGDYEKLSSFQQRLKCEFPGATFINMNSVVSENIKQGSAYCIQTCNVKPISLFAESYEVQSLPEQVLNFYKTNEVDRFQFDRPFHRGQKDEENLFKTLHVERTQLVTSSKLPGILCWFEVIQSDTKQLTPIELAIETVINKNRQIRHLVGQYGTTGSTTAPPGGTNNLNPLSMILNGVIDAAVNGGITKYQQAFFSSEYLAEHPEHELLINQLKSSFLEQVHILQGALSLHGRQAPENVQPLHHKLVEMFSIMKKTIVESNTSNGTYPICPESRDSATISSEDGSLLDEGNSGVFGESFTETSSASDLQQVSNDAYLKDYRRPSETSITAPASWSSLSQCTEISRTRPRHKIWAQVLKQHVSPSHRLTQADSEAYDSFSLENGPPIPPRTKTTFRSGPSVSLSEMPPNIPPKRRPPTRQSSVPVHNTNYTPPTTNKANTAPTSTNHSPRHGANGGPPRPHNASPRHAAPTAAPAKPAKSSQGGGDASTSKSLFYVPSEPPRPAIPPRVNKTSSSSKLM